MSVLDIQHRLDVQMFGQRHGPKIALHVEGDQVPLEVRANLETVPQDARFEHIQRFE